MTEATNAAGDRIVWENSMEMLDDIWAARKERDALRRRVSDLEMIIKFMENGDEVYRVD